MPRCAKCGAEHEFLDPVFVRPDAFLRLSKDVRQKFAHADDDLCRIALPDQPVRFFVRCVLPVQVRDHQQDLWWGLWAEVAESTFNRIVELWESPGQDKEPLLDGSLANLIPGYPDTRQLQVRIRLIGPTSRPTLQFQVPFDHPFVEECVSGVDAHRAAEWNVLITEGA